MSGPSYHLTTDRATGREVLFTRHALPPHDVVGRIEFESAAKMREVANFLNEAADAKDIVDAISIADLLGGHTKEGE